MPARKPKPAQGKNRDDPAGRTWAAFVRADMMKKKSAGWGSLPHAPARRHRSAQAGRLPHHAPAKRLFAGRDPDRSTQSAADDLLHRSVDLSLPAAGNDGT